VNYSSGPDSLDRFNNLPAVKIFGATRPGFSSGQAIERMEQIAKETLPPEFSFDWGGASFQEKRSGGTSILALGLAALMVFLILAAQYDRWSLPLAVLLALPFGTFGALAAIFINNLLPMPYYLSMGIPLLNDLLSPLGRIARLSNDVYFQIGLVTLLGLAAKNAILIVEFAVMKAHEGMSTAAAAVEAARLRFRPILMTSLAFILGVMPLAFSSGAGAGARHSAGTGVMGGMLAATFLAIFFIPWFFKLIVDRKLSESRSTAEIEEEAKRYREAAQRATRGAHHHPVAKGDGDA
jgi:multidrug efflux pump subunit AcrB